MTVTVSDLNGNEIASGSTAYPLNWGAGVSYGGESVGSSKLEYQMDYSVQLPPLEGSTVDLPPGFQQWPSGWMTFKYAAWGLYQDPLSGGDSETIKTNVPIEFPCWLKSWLK